MKNRFFILFMILFSLSLYAQSSLDLGDKAFQNKNYKKALLHYEELYKKSDTSSKNNLEIKLRIVQSYIRLADNYFKIKEYNNALEYYKKATQLQPSSFILKEKIAFVYEKQADEFNVIYQYKKALTLYKKALNLHINSKNKTPLQNKINKLNKHFAHQKKLTTDTRVLVDTKSPSWTHAIGRLIIPTKLDILKNKRYKVNQKKCSATLVNLEPDKDSQVIITASHCLSQYNKKAGQIKFIIKDNKNEMLYRIATITFDSNFDTKKLKYRSDFAILTLHKSISPKDVQALIIKKDSFNTLQKKHKQHFGALGGFSSDIAKYGEQLTFDPKCILEKHTKTFGYSSCKGFHGASGGPIVLTTIENTKIGSKQESYHFVGVVSHFKNKDFTNIYFAPHHLFYDEIQKTIRSFY